MDNKVTKQLNRVWSIWSTRQQLWSNIWWRLHRWIKQRAWDLKSSLPIRLRTFTWLMLPHKCMYAGQYNIISHFGKFCIPQLCERKNSLFWHLANEKGIHFKQVRQQWEMLACWTSSWPGLTGEQLWGLMLPYLGWLPLQVHSRFFFSVYLSLCSN